MSSMTVCCKATKQFVNGALGVGFVILIVQLHQVQPQIPTNTIVPDVTADCPIATVQYTPEEFSADRLFSVLTPLLSSGLHEPCASSVTNLVICSTDGTLQVKEGCCSTQCSAAIQGLLKASTECYRLFVSFFCNGTDPEVPPLQPVMFGAARRCVGLNPSCDLLSQPGDLLPPWFEDMQGGNATNATSATQPGANATAVPGTSAALPGANESAIGVAGGMGVNNSSTAVAQEPAMGSAGQSGPSDTTGTLPGASSSAGGAEVAALPAATPAVTTAGQPMNNGTLGVEPAGH